MTIGSQKASSQVPARTLNLFSLVMINVIAVAGLRTLPNSAKFGASLIFYYALFTVFFLIPVALVTAELATTWPQRGGVYIWVREAFGPRIGFLVVWLQWLYNVVWYPTILGSVAGTLFYVQDPTKAPDPYFVIAVILIIFWLSTFVNTFGMKISSWISTFGSLIGTLIPMLFIIGLSGYWFWSGQTVQISFTAKSIIPSVDELKNNLPHLALLSGLLFGLMGLEMSAVHAQEVQDPKRQYPQALGLSAAVIVFFLVVASLAVAVVVPQSKLDLVTGVMQAFNEFLTHLKLSSWMPLVAALVIIGAIGSVATWIVGPTKALLASTQDHSLLKWFAVVNRHSVPVRILWTQASIVTILSLAYVLRPTVEASYWILIALTAILALFMYLLMFAAALKLRYSKDQIHRPFRIPGGNWGMWLVALSGIITCVLVLALSLLAPEETAVQESAQYAWSMALGALLLCIPAWLLGKGSKA